MIPRTIIWLVLTLSVAGQPPAPAQERVTPVKSKGGKPLGEPWAGVPEEFKRLKLPEWKLPDDLVMVQSELEERGRGVH